MPNVTAPTRNDQNGQSSTYFVDSVSTTSTTFTYPAQQDALTVTNKGNFTITLTVNGMAYTIQGGGVQSVPQLFTSFTIVAAGQTAFDAMAISETSNNVQITSSLLQPKFNYKPITAMDFPVAWNVNTGELYYSAVGRELRKTTDFGVTYTTVATCAVNESFAVGHVSLFDGNVYAFSSNPSNNSTSLYRSIDGGNSFTKIDLSALGTVYAPMYKGMDSNPYQPYFYFAEYSATPGANMRVIGTVDGGATWAARLTVPTGSGAGQIRHFHTVNCQPSIQKWYVTSGDADSQVGWWESSSSNGTSFTKMAQVPADQRFRSVSLVFPDRSTVMWGVDTTSWTTVDSGIYKAHWGELTYPRRMVTLPTSCWGLTGSGNLLMAVTHCELIGEGNKNGYVWLSEDCGETWNMEYKQPVVDGQIFGGFNKVVGPMKDGSYLVCGRNLANGIGFYLVTMK